MNKQQELAAIEDILAHSIGILLSSVHSDQSYSACRLSLADGVGANSSLTPCADMAERSAFRTSGLDLE